MTKRTGVTRLPIVLVALMLAVSFGRPMRAADAAEGVAKPKVAVFPLAGDASEDLRAKCGFSLRQKLDREGTYEIIDGYRMAELAEPAGGTVALTTEPDAVTKLADGEDARVLIWGDLTNGAGGATMRLKLLDLREREPKVREVQHLIAAPTDLRFVAEAVLETLPGVKKFEHMSDVAVTDDATAAVLWKRNPNLVTNFDFSKDGAWHALYMAEKYPVQISDALPAVDKVNIYRLPAEKGQAGSSKPNTVLAMNLSRFCAENAGMACISEKFKIEPNTRYRISFRYMSEAPTLHVFVKGYTMGEDIKGKPTEREIYRRQVPPSGATGGKWVTIVDDLNPQHVAFPVQYLKVDLYAYLNPGVVMFDDVVVKAVGTQTRNAKDAAIDTPIDRPAKVVEKEKRREAGETSAGDKK